MKNNTGMWQGVAGNMICEHQGIFHIRKYDTAKVLCNNKE